MDVISAIVLSALVLGSLFGLMGVGLSLIWSTLRVFNFGQGALLMLGAYVGWTFTNKLHWPIYLSAIAAVVVLALFGAVYEMLLIRTLITRQGGDLAVMVATLAATMLLESGAQLAWGPQAKQLPQLGNLRVQIAHSVVSGTQIVAIVLAPILIGGVWFALQRSALGLRIRALESNRDHAQLIGIRPTRVYLYVVMTAAGLAGIAGVLLGSLQFMSPTMGDDPLLDAFVVIAFGGAGSIGGTLVGAYAIGLLSAVTTYYWGLTWSPVLVFFAMIAVMLARPQGLLAGPRVRTA